MLNEGLKTAIFPGSFNPFHQGHFAILKKALTLFDFVYIVVTQNPDKNQRDDFKDNANQIDELLKSNNINNVDVLINKNEFTADVAKKLGAKFLIRSARNNVDFDYELSLAAGNKELNPELETILIFPDYENINYSSTLERHRKLMKK